MRKHVRLLFTCAFAAALGGGLFSTTSVRATLFTGADDSVINNELNWDDGLPDNFGNDGTVPSGFDTTHSDVNALDNANITFLGNSSLTGSAQVRVENSTLTFKDSSSWSLIGTIALGRDAAPVGDSILNIQDNASVSMTACFKVARAQNAFVNQSGGTVLLPSDTLDLGNSNGGVGTYTLSAGTVTASGMNIYDDGSSKFNFTLGSTGVLTVLNGGVDYTAGFEGFITDGDITLGGASAGSGDFLIAYDNGSTSIQQS
ncbi:hypothetical protein [Bythopirellula polymerisocia]|uniref:Autotransporter-associated beta strand repeat protein n=1 Tax=Bythopirellula polymerisocia TaxID=2528003 RepID=A0A5C6C9T2_9BACT|nr:hypothetical protein [Bythopirellula polymerisocia]TWU21350.1 hypothetical protein Pla144_45700 [Bythopirellula polymerisocia]